MADKPIIWVCQEGGQKKFLACPLFEVLGEGNRGGGKTDALLMDYYQFVGQGFGEAWKGILFRKTYKQLTDVISKSWKWFKQTCPTAKYNRSEYFWEFPGGERLLLRYMERPEDYWNYHGHEYPWIGWEELTNWADAKCYESMIACCRSSKEDMPRRVRSTTNPYGKGHNWVKTYFIDPAPIGIPSLNEKTGELKIAIHLDLDDNLALLKADPKYKNRLKGISEENKRKAWLEGSWDITSGGGIDDIWNREIHVIRPFDIPADWRVDRSFDWGSSKPYSVGYWAEANGNPVTLRDGTQRTFPRGTLFRIAEKYGWNGVPNTGTQELAVEIAQKVVSIDKQLQKKYGVRVKPGPADSSIFDVVEGDSIADKMKKAGAKWVPANKGPGSRKNGLEILRQYLKASLPKKPEKPGLYIFDTCTHWIRTVPTLPRSEKDPDDIDTEAEDHAYDETRYRLLTKKHGKKTQNTHM